jgi:adenylate kinase
MENIRSFLRKITPVGFFKKLHKPVKKIMMTGPQGSGKTTQAKMLAEKLGFKYIGMGDLLREYILNKGEGYEAIDAAMKKGELVGDQTVCRLIKKRLAESDCKKGVIVDGYPRTMEQKQIYDPNYDDVFYVKISNEEALKRLMSRGRSDDSPKIIAERLRLYHEETRPLLDVFLQEGKLLVVDGEKPIEEVTMQINNHLSLEA